MDLGLDGRVAVVTGASKGIGLAITRALVAEGATSSPAPATVSDELDELADEGRRRPSSRSTSPTPTGPAELVAAAAPSSAASTSSSTTSARVTPRLDGFLSRDRRPVAAPRSTST